MKYSITIPAYKAEFLGKCIESILAQTYSDFELIIVNDASPEDLDTIVNYYDDPRIKYYINEKNCGAIDVVDNWNICLSYATGDYLICMGDDDELSPDCLELYNLLMDKYPDLDIYHGRVKVIDENSDFVSLQEARPAFESVYSMIWHRMNGRIQFIGDFLFKRSILVSKGGFYKIALAWGSDDISSYIMASDKGVANTYEPIFFYRVNGMSISSSVNVDLKLYALGSHKKWIIDFLSSHSKLNQLDSYYSSMILSQLNLYFTKRQSSTIQKDLDHSKYPLFRFIYWLIRCKKIDLLKTTVFRAYAQSLKSRIKNIIVN